MAAWNNLTFVAESFYRFIRATNIDERQPSVYVDTVITTELVSGSTDQDPAVGLRAIAALRRLIEQLEELQVRNARGQGWSWADIADAVGVSKQAVHKKYAGRLASRTDRSR